jgi:ribonucleotide reductase beta subunit family protein with ferritin-like domain
MSEVEVHPKSFDADEELLKEDKSRYVLFPIKYPDIFKMYKQASSSYWVADEINFEQDTNDWNKLSDDERYFLKHVLAFFAGSDGVIIENIGANFIQEIPIPEIQLFYSYQLASESTHSETYALSIDFFCKNDEKEKQQLFEAINTYPAISKKINWGVQWIANKEASFAQRLIAFVIVEGLFFAASFCAIFYFRDRNILPALSFSNQLISRDESLHFSFGQLLYSKIKNRLPEEMVHKMFKEAVEIEQEFITESLPVSLIGMNPDLMTQYIKYMADFLITPLGYSKIYDVSNPFSFMEYSSFEGKQNFFDGKNSAYSLSGVSLVPGKSTTPSNLTVSDDF